MTGFCLAPYPLDTIRRFTLIALAVAPWGCATDAATRAELQELRASVRALRQETARLDARVEALSVGRSAPAAQAAPAPPPATAVATAAVPPLTVVKLKPRSQAPPAVSTRVDVQEPPEGLAGALKGASAEEGADEVDLAMAEAAYERGLSALKTGNVDGGMQQLRRFAEGWPRHPRADNALYFVALALQSRRELEEAAGLLERVALEYPAGDVAVDALLKLGECRLRLNQPQAAKATWEKIVFTFPGTAAATLAQTRLAALSVDPAKSQP